MDAQLPCGTMHIAHSSRLQTYILDGNLYDNKFLEGGKIMEGGTEPEEELEACALMLNKKKVSRGSMYNQQLKHLALPSAPRAASYAVDHETHRCAPAEHTAACMRDGRHQ